MQEVTVGAKDFSICRIRARQHVHHREEMNEYAFHSSEPLRIRSSLAEESGRARTPAKSKLRHAISDANMLKSGCSSSALKKQTARKFHRHQISHADIHERLNKMMRIQIQRFIRRHNSISTIADRMRNKRGRVLSCKSETH